MLQGMQEGSIFKTLRRITDSYWVRRTPRYHVGSVFANRLGLQVGRVLARNVKWGLRTKQVSPDVQTYLVRMERDGIVVIPDFLPEEAFASVKADFDRSRDEANRLGYTHNHLNGLLQETRNLSAEPDRFPAVRVHLEENPIVYRIVSATLRCRIKYTAPVYAEIWRCPDPASQNMDLENVLHADVHYPTVKLWLYMNEIDGANAAFTYARGSQKFTFYRMMHEYDLSVREALMKRGRATPHLLDRGRNRIADHYLAKMKVAEGQICGKPNTLVISNNFGFHKRGVFSRTVERATLGMSFRYVESLHHFIYPRFNSTARSANQYEPGQVPGSSLRSNRSLLGK